MNLHTWTKHMSWHMWSHQFYIIFWGAISDALFWLLLHCCTTTLWQFLKFELRCKALQAGVHTYLTFFRKQINWAIKHTGDPPTWKDVQKPVWSFFVFSLVQNLCLKDHLLNVL
jgi:hypothetical protein